MSHEYNHETHLGSETHMEGQIGRYNASGGRSDGFDIPGNRSQGLQTASVKDQIMKPIIMIQTIRIIILTFMMILYCNFMKTVLLTVGVKG